MRSRRPGVATSPPRGGRSGGRSVWMDLKGEDVARTQRWWRRAFSVDLLIGHPEMINFATSFWAGFASHPSHRLHPTTPGLTPQTHKWTQVPLAGSDSEHLRWRFCLSLSLGTVSLFTPSLLKKTGPAIASDQCREAEAPPSKAGNESRGRKG